MVNFIIFLLPTLVYIANPAKRENFRPMIQLILITWSIHIVNATCGGGLSFVFAIRPRQIFCFPNIILSHVFHYVDTQEEDFRYRNYHLRSSTVEFWLFGSLIALNDVSHLRNGIQVFNNGAGLFVAVTISVALISGIGAWMFGRDRCLYFGAQGVIFGYIGFLLVYGIHLGVLKEVFSSDSTLEALPDTLEGLFRFIFWILGNIWILVTNALTGKLFVGPGKIMLLILLMISFFLVSARFNFLSTATTVLAKMSQIQQIEEAGEVVPPDLKTEAEKGGKMLSKVFSILFLRNVESVFCGLIGGLMTGYFIMLYYG